MSAVDRQPYKIAWHDYDIFLGCFGDTKIMPADLDFIVERHGKFLVMEFKEIGKDMFIGQDITLKKLSKLPGFTVFLAYHEPRKKCHECESVHDSPNFVSMKIYPNGELFKINNEILISFVKNWYKQADNIYSNAML